MRWPRFSQFRYRYLFRFCFTIMTAVLIPVVIFAFIMLRTSYNELIRKNEEFYIHVTNTYAAFVENEMLSMRSFALSLSVKSNQSDYSVLNLENANGNSYYIYEIVNLLKNQSILGNNNVILYYRDADYVITAKYKYTLDEYLFTVTGANTEEAGKLRSFFDFDPADRITYISLFPSRYYTDAVFYVGVPVKMGAKQMDVLVVFELNSASIEASMFTSQSGHDLDLLIFDAKNSLMYSNANIDHSLISGNGFDEFMSNDNTNIFSINNYTIFKSSIGTGCKYVAILPDDEIMSDVRAFYSISKRIVALMLSILALFAAAVVYLNYKPINKLVKRVGRFRAASRGDLPVIELAIDQMQLEAHEQNMIIMESLLNNILYGAPIPQTLIKRYDFLNHTGGYCLMTIPEIRLDQRQRERLAAAVFDKFNVKMYITEIPDDNFTVIICLVKNNDKRNEMPIITRYVKSLIPQIDSGSQVEVFTGNVVDTISKIRRSYIKCINQMHLPIYSPSEPMSACENNEKQALKEKMMVFISDNLMNPQLCQSMVADRFGMSVYSLSRFFREQIGLGFTDYITARRLDCAKRLLITTGMSIADIANAVGVSNANYFSRMFKSNCGITPGQFRDNF